MPLVRSNINVPGGSLRGHFQTIIPAITRATKDIYRRHWTINTPDGDLLELSCTDTRSTKAVLLTHGLEGSAETGYMTGMATYLSSMGFEVYAWSFRGCGKQLNPGPWYYHSGKTEDLHLVIEHITSTCKVDSLHLIGFSVGGNITLKYLGEEKYSLHPAIKAAVCISTPLHLKDCAIHLEKGINQIYLKRFLTSLRNKLKLKEKQYPGSINLEGLNEIRDFISFDGKYTAPHSGFRDADDYYEKSSSLHYIQQVKTKTLLLNALNDPFLAPSSFPYALASEHPYLYLEVPQGGGHVGFKDGLIFGSFKSEQRVFEFISANQ